MIDFHCHLDLYPNYKEIRQECDRRGMYVLSVTTTPSAWAGTSTLAQGSPRIRTALGLHPQLAAARKSELALFDELLLSARYVGEIGLDGAPEFKSSWQDQVSVFEQILDKCANSGGRVMSIHSRRASGPVLDCLERQPKAGTPVLHWFSGSLRELDRAVSLGCWFSVGPAMLANEKGRSLAKRMPPERVLTESDGPFGQVDRKPLFPWQVELALESLAEIWSVKTEEAHETLHVNLRNLLTNTELRTAPQAH